MNMRVQLQQLTADDSAAEFSNSLLQLGNGNLMIDGNGSIELPFGTCVNNRKERYEAIFPNLSDTIPTPKWLSQRAILAPRNDGVYFISGLLARTFPGEYLLHTSIDTVMGEDEAVN